MPVSDSKKTLLQRRRDAGDCLQCGKPAGGKARCRECSEKAKESRKRTQQKKKDAGLCQNSGCSNKTMPDRTVCETCSKKASDSALRRYYRNKEAGVCRYCGGESSGRSRCDTCRESLKKHQATWYDGRKQAGLCVFCGTKAETETLCRVCREKHRLYSKDRTDELRQAVLDAYGRECAECGQDDEDLLQVDHVEGGGGKHRKEIGQSNLYLWLRQNEFPKGFQILCASCNWKKR